MNGSKRHIGADTRSPRQQTRSMTTALNGHKSVASSDVPAPRSRKMVSATRHPRLKYALRFRPSRRGMGTSRSSGGRWAACGDAIIISERCRSWISQRGRPATESSNMRLAIFALVLAIFGSTSTNAQDRIGESCIGTETIQVGANVPKVVPYALKFSADLAAGYYCYAKCRPEQTYAITDPKSDPIKLADVHGGNQTRLITFDRITAIFTDYQVVRLLGSTTRTAKATCRATAFHQPAPLRAG